MRDIGVAVVEAEEDGGDAVRLGLGERRIVIEKRGDAGEVP